MLIRLSNNLRLRISRLVWLEVDPKPQLELKLQNLHLVDVPAPLDGYTLKVYTPKDELQLVSL